jgi:hypothetical protein
MAANNYKLIFVASDSADVAKKIAESMAKLPGTANGPVVLSTKVYERVVTPTDTKDAPFTKHICQVLGTPSAITHASTLADFSGSEYIYLDAPDDAFQTSVVLTGKADAYLTFNQEAPAKDTGSDESKTPTNNAAPKAGK